MSSDFNLRCPWQEPAGPEARVHVLVQFKSDVSMLREMGCEVTSRAGDIAGVFVRAESLEALRRHPEVRYVETTCALRDETDVSAAEINLVEPVKGSRVIPGDGRGALIGIIDSGFDLTHPCFLDKEGRTRICAAWDQANLAALAGVSPPAFGYGVEYTGEAIDGHVAAQRILVVKNHVGAGAHGTYVAGIAAGEGAPHYAHRGVAPGADLILVTYRNDVPVGGSAYVLDAIDYIRQHARALGRPVVINLSQGDNLGAHDGTSLLERAIDHVVEEGRVLVIVSAGNERGGPASHHARGKVERGRELALSFELVKGPGRVVDGDTIELWYSGRDRFAVALQAPGGERSDFVEPGGRDIVIEFHAGNRARVCSQTGHPTNGDNRVRITLERSEAWGTGPWQLILRGDRAERGDFDAWADRPNAVTVIDFRSHQSDASTITLPGNSRRAITVGGFISRPSPGENAGEVKGDFAPGSSVGPTRDGRVKPDLTAPSTLVTAPRVRKDGRPPCYDLRSGTSMAAPHVTGVVALLWSLWPGLAAGQIRDTLLSTARADAFTGVTPNTNWGHGKLDAGATYEALSILVEKGEAKMSATQVFEFETSPQGNRFGEPVGMKIRIELGGDGLVITGTSTGAYEGKNYVGTLALRKAFSGLEGGDECWINGRWVSPCPSGAGEEDDAESAEAEGSTDEEE
ncbi:MAG: S8 family peptidase [Acidobacteria bacterium]|nr:S8 family peptidase [Acidobacteriota bacterium]